MVGAVHTDWSIGPMKGRNRLSGLTMILSAVACRVVDAVVIWCVSATKGKPFHSVAIPQWDARTAKGRNRAPGLAAMPGAVARHEIDAILAAFQEPRERLQLWMPYVEF